MLLNVTRIASKTDCIWSILYYLCADVVCRPHSDWLYVCECVYLVIEIMRKILVCHFELILWHKCICASSVFMAMWPNQHSLSWIILLCSFCHLKRIQCKYHVVLFMYMRCNIFDNTHLRCFRMRTHWYNIQIIKISIDYWIYNLLSEIIVTLHHLNDKYKQISSIFVHTIWTIKCWIFYHIPCS